MTFGPSFESGGDVAKGLHLKKSYIVLTVFVGGGLKKILGLGVTELAYIPKLKRNVPGNGSWMF